MRSTRRASSTVRTKGSSPGLMPSLSGRSDMVFHAGFEGHEAQSVKRPDESLVGCDIDGFVGVPVSDVNSFVALDLAEQDQIVGEPKAIHESSLDIRSRTKGRQ